MDLIEGLLFCLEHPDNVLGGTVSAQACHGCHCHCARNSDRQVNTVDVMCRLSPLLVSRSSGCGSSVGLRNGTAALGQSSEVKEFPEGRVGLGGIGSQGQGWQPCAWVWGVLLQPFSPASTGGGSCGKWLLLEEPANAWSGVRPGRKGVLGRPDPVA